MKEFHLKGVSLVLFTCLIVVVTSWAFATPEPSQDKKKKGAATADQDPPSHVTVEADKTRYVMMIGGNCGTENEKFIIYDSWALAETQDVWLLEKPHTTSPKWARMKFDKKKR